MRRGYVDSRLFVYSLLFSAICIWLSVNELHINFNLRVCIFYGITSYDFYLGFLHICVGLMYDF